MATVTDELVTRFTLDDRYSPKTRAIAASTRAMGSQIKGAVSAVGSGFTSIGSAVVGIGRSIIGVIGNIAASLTSSLIFGITGAIAAVGALAVASMRTAADIEALRMGLVAVTGSVAIAEREFIKLREVAKLPGLGLEEALQGSVNLIAAGLSADQARAALLAFGNALATVGKGKAELEGVITALTQIAAKGKISAEEILQLQERLPQIRQAMQAAFGTSDTEMLSKMGIGSAEFIDRITAEFAKLPKVAGGAKNAFENLTDALKIGMARGGAVINQTVVPAISTLSDHIIKLAEGGEFDKVVKGFIGMFSAPGQLGSTLTGIFDKILQFMKDLPGHIVGAVQFLRTLFDDVKAFLQGFKDGVVEVMDFMGGASDALNPTGDPYADAKKNWEKAHASAIEGDKAESQSKVISDQRARDKQHLQGVVASAAARIGEIAGAGSSAGQVGSVTTYQRQVADNTKQMVDLQREQVDLQKIALGGGRTGGDGISAVELSSIKGEVRGGRGGSKLEKAVRLIRESAVDEIYNILRDQRSGARA